MLSILLSQRDGVFMGSRTSAKLASIALLLLLAGCMSASGCATSGQRADVGESQNAVIQPAESLVYRDHWLDDPVTSERDIFQFRKFDSSEEKYQSPTVIHFLPDEEPGSRSLGTSTQGELYGAVALAGQGETWRILVRQRARDLNFGHASIIRLIEDASKEVAEAYPDSVLLVGNIGHAHGGPIRYSVSHQNGKDADLAFYTTDADGNSVDAPDLLIFNDDGRSRAYDGYYHFDVPRNWALVEALLQSEHAEIQYLFISNGLKKLLMDYAHEQNVSDALLSQANLVLRQPGVQAPHDDHLHIRIFCGAEDIMVGCEDFGVRHAWAPSRQFSSRSARERAVHYLTHETSEGRSAALQRLLFLEARSEAASIVPLLDDDSTEVRIDAAKVLLQLQESLGVAEIAARLNTEADAKVVFRWIDALRHHPSDEMARVLVNYLEDEQTAASRSATIHEEKGATAELYAVDVLGHSESLVALPILAAYLKDERVDLRSRAADGIVLLANQRPSPFDWAEPTAAPPEVFLAAELWMGWVQTALQRHDTRIALALEGLRAHGYDTPRRGRELAASLADAAGDSHRHIRVNAQRMLMAMTSERPESLAWSPEDARAYWTRWVSRNPRRIVALR